METWFGHNFDGVRLHTDYLAAASARALSARAYTVGSHIVFGRERYNPGTREGLWLLAHELSHVVQQGGECSMPPLGVADAKDPLELEAHQAADIIAAGYALPRDFAFGAAPAGVIQRHEGPPCGGWSSLVDNITVPLAERVLELAYGGRPLANVMDVVVYGSNDFRLPVNVGLGGRSTWAYATELLDTIRSWPREERPNILNFGEREAYFFWRFPAPARVVGIINRFHATEHRIGLRHKQHAWNSINANWFPDHVLPFPPDPLERFVCTSMTNHNPPRGLILYDIRQAKKPRRAQRRATSYQLWTADTDMAEFFPSLKDELPNAVRFYDPENSNFVLIVPADFYYEYYNQKKTSKIWELHKVKPSYNFPGSQAVKELRSRLHHLAKILGVVALGVIVVGSIALVVALPAAPAGAGAVATTGTAAGAGAGATAVSLPITSTITVPAGTAAKVTALGTAAAVAGGGVTAALWALAAAPSVKAVSLAAGVLLVIGTVNNAHAGTSLPDKPVVSKVSAFRAVAVADFNPSEECRLPSAPGRRWTSFTPPTRQEGNSTSGRECSSTTFRISSLEGSLRVRILLYPSVRLFSSIIYLWWLGY